MGTSEATFVTIFIFGLGPDHKWENSPQCFLKILCDYLVILPKIVSVRGLLLYLIYLLLYSYYYLLLLRY